MYAVVARTLLLDFPVERREQQAIEQHKQVLFARQSRQGHWNKSLAETAHSVELLLWLGLSPTHERLVAAGQWLMSRCSDEAIVKGMPHPEERELIKDAKLFTGQAVGSENSYRFQLGLGALRALWLLGVESTELSAVEYRLFDLLAKPPGWLCCLNLATAYWAVSVSPVISQASFVAEGLSRLLAAEVRPGKWRGTLRPWYMYYVLSEWPGAPARRLANTDAPFLKQAQKRDGSFSRGYYSEQRTFALTKLLKAAGMLED